MPTSRKLSRRQGANAARPTVCTDRLPAAPRQDAVTAHEFRGSPRHPVAIPVAVRFNSSGQYEFSSVSRNLSETGIFLHFDQPVAVGEEVTLKLSLPSADTAPQRMTIRGNVARVEQSGLPGIAIAFRELVIAPTAAAAWE